MDVSTNWLRELVPGLEASPRELADRLSLEAVPVDGIRTVGGGLEEIRVARALDVRPHPNADRLLLCRIDPGSDGAVDLVCGAPVVEEGALYAWVPPGASLPGGMRIEAREIRGIMSHGMLCSEHELGLGRDKSGILRLPPELEPGQPLTEALDLPDHLLLLDLTPNRVDLACHVGVARELAPGGGADIRLRDFGPDWRPVWRDGEETAEAAGVPVTIDDPDRCPRYLGAVVRGVRIGPSPAWLASRLRAVGLRPVNNVVDATNYVLMELNQPLHAFDLGKLQGPEIRVRAAAPGERLRTLDGELRELQPAATVIADAQGPVALAGVMGGEESEVTAGTTEVFLECAAFHPLHARHTARSLDLATEASYRFERGIDERGLDHALTRCVRLILAVAGGEAAAEASRVGRPAPARAEVRLRRERVERVLGIAPDAFETRRLLEPLGFELADDAPAAGVLRVLVPGWRPDVTREIDLIEEVARRHGYEAFPDDPRSFRPSAVPDDAAWARVDRVRELFVARGFLEARSSTFVPETQPGGGARVSVLNPLSAEEAWLRSGIVPVLLRRVEHNWARSRRDVRLFEVGTVFDLDPKRATGRERFPEELRVGAVMTGRRRPPHWSEQGEDLDLWDLKGLGEEMAESLCRGALEPIEEEDAEPGTGDGAGVDWLEAGGFRIVREGEIVGWAGRVRGNAVDAPPWASRVWGVELLLAAVALDRQGPYEAVPPYPAVRRDLALVLPGGVPAAAVEACIGEAGQEILEAVSLFDVYEGEGIEPGRRSLAWGLRFRAADRTLTDPEVEEAMDRIISALEDAFDAHVRTS